MYAKVVAFAMQSCGSAGCAPVPPAVQDGDGLTCCALLIAAVKGSVVACRRLIQTSKVVWARIGVVGKVSHGAVRVIVLITTEAVALAELRLVAAEVDAWTLYVGHCLTSRPVVAGCCHQRNKEEKGEDGGLCRAHRDIDV